MLLAVSVDPPADTRKLLSKLDDIPGQTSITYLEDKEHKVIDRYGLFNPKSVTRKIPYPATYVIDTAGIVRWRFIEIDYRLRPTNQAIVEAVKQTGKSAGSWPGRN